MSIESSKTIDLAKEFIEYSNNALRAERDYFSKGNSEMVSRLKKLYDIYTHDNSYITIQHWETGRCIGPINKWNYKPSTEDEWLKRSEPYEWDENSLFPMAHQFPDMLETLNNSLHEFQDRLIDDHEYCSAIKNFRKKEIYNFLDPEYEKKEQPALNLEVLLDKIIAETIIRWHELKTKGIERYMLANKEHVQKIVKYAQKLLKSINDAPDFVRESIPGNRGIEYLANGMIGPRRPLERAHLDFVDYRYLPQKKHGLVEREFLLRELTAKYMYIFGSYELKTKPNDQHIDAHILRDNVERVTKIPSDKYIAIRSEPIIHADVIASFLSLIDSELSETDVRKIQEYAQIQKERERKYRFFEYNLNYHMMPN